MNMWGLATDFLCKNKVQEEINYYEQYNVFLIITTLSSVYMMYNMYSYRKLKRTYDELKKKAGLDEAIKNIYMDLCERTESDSDSECESGSEEEEGEYDMEDIDLNNK